MTRFALTILIGLTAAFVLIMVLSGVVVWLLLRPGVTPLEQLTVHSTPAPAFSDPLQITFLEEDSDAYEERIKAVLRTEEYRDWEHEAQAALASTARFRDGRTMAEIFFRVFEDLFYGWTVNKPDRAREMVSNWKRRFKDSEAARIAEIYVHLDDAWTARGGGYASTVTKEGWEGFAYYLDEAEDAFYACLEDGIDYPIVYAVGLRIALGQGWSREETEALFLEGYEKDPLCRLLYGNLAYYLLPKWYGSGEDAEKFFYIARDLPRPYVGGTMGFYVACYYDTQVSRSNPDFEFRIPWDELVATYRDFASVFPDAVEYHNRMAYLACDYGEKEFAAELFQSAASTHDPSIWSAKTYESWREWAVNNAAPPLFSDLHQAAEENDVEAIQAILGDGVDIEHTDNSGLTALFYAVREGNREAAEALLDAGADPNAPVDGKNHSILWRAIQYRNQEMAELLMSRGGDLMSEYSEGQPLFLMLMYRDMIDLVEKAVQELGFDVNLKSANGTTVLHIASQQGNVDAIKRLLALRADINIRNNREGTPLLAAADNAKEDAVRYLLEHGADANLGTDENWTPLMSAADHNLTGMAEALLAHGAELMARDHTGWTALHMAVMDGHKEVLRVLLAAPGADVNAATDEKRTLMHQAAKSGHPELIRYLLDQGADLNPRNAAGKTPLDLAVEEEKTETVKLLESLGAERGMPAEASTGSEP